MILESGESFVMTLLRAVDRVAAHGTVRKIVKKEINSVDPEKANHGQG
jgi:hypothetical protein